MRANAPGWPSLIRVRNPWRTIHFRFADPLCIHSSWWRWREACGPSTCRARRPRRSRRCPRERGLPEIVNFPSSNPLFTYFRRFKLVLCRIRFLFDSDSGSLSYWNHYFWNRFRNRSPKESSKESKKNRFSIHNSLFLRPRFWNRFHILRNRHSTSMDGIF